MNGFTSYPWDDLSDWDRSKRATFQIIDILRGQSLSNDDVDSICRILAICRNPHIQPPYKLVIGKK